MKQVTELLSKSQPKSNAVAVDGQTQRVAQVIELDELPGQRIDSVGETPVLANINPLHAIKAKLQVCVGQTEISLGDLIAAKESDVLILDRKIDEAVDLLLSGKVVARGLLVASEGRFAIRITELPLPLKP